MLNFIQFYFSMVIHFIANHLLINQSSHFFIGDFTAKMSFKHPDNVRNEDFSLFWRNDSLIYLNLIISVGILLVLVHLI